MRGMTAHRWKPFTALVGAAAVVCVIAVYGVRSGAPKVNDPVAVKVEGDGQQLIVVVDRCVGLHVTRVKVVAEPRTGAGVPLVLWDYSPPPGLNQFSTSSTAAGRVQTAYADLSHVSSDDRLAAYLYYERDSAPAKFRNRDNLVTVFTRVQSPSQLAKFDKINSKSAC